MAPPSAHCTRRCSGSTSLAGRRATTSSLWTILVRDWWPGYGLCVLAGLGLLWIFGRTGAIFKCASPFGDTAGLAIASGIDAETLLAR